MDMDREKQTGIKVVGIRFKEVGKIYYFDPDDMDIKAGEQVIVETVRGQEYGDAVVGPRFIEPSEVNQPLKKIVRKATEEDREQVRRNEQDERDALKLCSDKVVEHKLPMKLVDVEYTFDRSKIIFYFTAEGRVDFRDLVKDLASVFRTRIELRQIGVRDEAKMIGGLGSCGRELCCSTFLGDFETVSIKMAKEQNLSLNPNKISGICGRLMCCLKYENETYELEKKRMPKEGSRVKTPFGVGSVDSVQLLQEKIVVKYADGKREIFALGEYERVDKQTPLDPMERGVVDDAISESAPVMRNRKPKEKPTRSDQKQRVEPKADENNVSPKQGESQKNNRRKRNNRNKKKRPEGQEALLQDKPKEETIATEEKKKKRHFRGKPKKKKAPSTGQPPQN